MVSRRDMSLAITDLRTWYFESMDEGYLDFEPVAPKFANIHPVSDEGKWSTKGGFWKGTSGVGMAELLDLDDYGKPQKDTPVDGYPVYARIKQKAISIFIPYEVERDFWRTKNFLKNYVKENGNNAVETTKEKLIMEAFNKAGFTSGDALFDSSSTDLNLTTYTSPKLSYDGVAPINRSGTNRSAKAHSTTYYNGLNSSKATPDFELAKDLYILLTSTNAYKENGVPFQNDKDVNILCNPSRALDWERIIYTKNMPGNANNDLNPVHNKIKSVYASPFFTTSSNQGTIMARQGLPWEVWFGEPRFDFFELHDPLKYGCTIYLDYAICQRNFRFMVGDQIATS